MRSSFFIVAILVGCQREPAASAGNAPAMAADNAPPADRHHASPSAAVTTRAALCPTPAGGLRLGLDTVAGMPAGLPVADLLRICPSARVDTVEERGFPLPAIRFEFQGATIWARQYVPDTDTIVPGQAAETWVGVGDSLRFPDGRLIPRRLGQLRAMDSVGIMYIPSGDNAEGADVGLCRVAGLSFLFDTLPAPADSALRPFAQISTAATISYRRVQQRRDTLGINHVRRLCARVGAT